MLKIKKSAYFLGTFFVLIFALSLAVRADDEEEDDENRASSQNSSVSAPVTKTETVTSLKVIMLSDSDGDGLLDKDDPHPEIAEIYIVEDGDKNGIVDEFEK